MDCLKESLRKFIDSCMRTIHNGKGQFALRGGGGRNLEAAIVSFLDVYQFTCPVHIEWGRGDPACR